MAAELMAMTSCTSFAPASACAWAEASSTLARAASRPISANFSRLARESWAKYENWLIAASLAAVIWSILNIGLDPYLGGGSSFAALHNDNLRAGEGEVKDYFVQRSNKD